MKTKTIYTPMHCDQCDALVINKMFCHEQDCPNSKKKWVDGQWILFVKCWDCGFDVEVGNSCDCMEPFEFEMEVE